MIHLGYEPGSKAFRLWNPATRSIVVSTNVKFDECLFPNRPPGQKPTPGPSTIPASPQPPPTHTVVPGILGDDDATPRESLQRPRSSISSRSSSPLDSSQGENNQSDCDSDAPEEEREDVPPPNTPPPSSAVAEPPFSQQSDPIQTTPPQSPAIPPPSAPCMNLNPFKSIRPVPPVSDLLKQRENFGKVDRANEESVKLLLATNPYNEPRAYLEAV